MRSLLAFVLCSALALPARAESRSCRDPLALTSPKSLSSDGKAGVWIESSESELLLDRAGRCVRLYREESEAADARHASVLALVRTSSLARASAERLAGEHELRANLWKSDAQTPRSGPSTIVVFVAGVVVGAGIAIGSALAYSRLDR